MNWVKNPLHSLNLSSSLSTLVIGFPLLRASVESQWLIHSGGAFADHFYDSTKNSSWKKFTYHALCLPYGVAWRNSPEKKFTRHFLLDGVLLPDSMKGLLGLPQLVIFNNLHAHVIW